MITPRLSKVILKALEAPTVPKRLTMGSDAWAQIGKHLELTAKRIDQWADVSASTDLNPYGADVGSRSISTLKIHNF